MEESASSKKSVDSQKGIPISKRLYAKVCGRLERFAMTGNRITIYENMHAKRPCSGDEGRFVILNMFSGCFSGQIRIGSQRIHIADILRRIGQSICRSRAADTEAVHCLNQLIGIADVHG